MSIAMILQGLAPGLANPSGGTEIKQQGLNTHLSYEMLDITIDGCMQELVSQWVLALSFDKLRVFRQEPVEFIKPITLSFPKGANNIFHASLVRKMGRCLAGLISGNPRQVIQAVHICRDHFEKWFGVRPIEIP